MIFDVQSKLSDAQAITATAVSTNVLDLKDTGRPYKFAADLVRNIGAGNPIPLLVQVVEDFTLLTSLTFTLETSDAENLTSSRVHWSSGAVLLASLIAGYKVPIFYVPNGPHLRYMGLRYTVAGTNPDAGKITAGLVADIQTNG